MNKIKKFLPLAVLFVLGIINIQLFRNTNLLNKSAEIGNYTEKINVLKKANRIFPHNHLVHTEMGRTYFEVASIDLTDTEQRDTHYERAVQNFIRAIKLNPGYYQSHFYFAQTLSFSHYFIPTEINFYDEYKKSARLTSFDTLAYFEVGRILFSRWMELSEEDKQYTLDLLKNIRMDIYFV